MVPKEYLNKVRGILDHLESSQLPAVDQAAAMVVHAFQNRGAVYCWTLGHGVEGDSLHRAGGLVGVQRFAFSFHLQDKVPKCRAEERRREAADRDLERIRFAVKSSNLRAGDVMLLASVSGKNRPAVELALSCRALGMKVIGFTAMAYTAKVKSLHPSGKNLFEACDVTVDIGAPYGDAAITIPGIEVEVMPISGVAMATSAWLIWGRVMELMTAAGDPPSVLMSGNREGGPEYNQKSIRQFEERGY